MKAHLFSLPIRVNLTISVSVPLQLSVLMVLSLLEIVTNSLILPSELSVNQSSVFKFSLAVAIGANRAPVAKVIKVNKIASARFIVCPFNRWGPKEAFARPVLLRGKRGRRRR